MCIKRDREDDDMGEHWIINAKLRVDGTLLEKVQAFKSFYNEDGLYMNRKWMKKLDLRFNYSRLEPENWLALWRVKFDLYGGPVSCDCCLGLPYLFWEENIMEVEEESPKRQKKIPIK